MSEKKKSKSLNEMLGKLRRDKKLSYKDIAERGMLPPPPDRGRDREGNGQSVDRCTKKDHPSSGNSAVGVLLTSWHFGKRGGSTGVFPRRRLHPAEQKEKPDSQGLPGCD